MKGNDGCFTVTLDGMLALAMVRRQRKGLPMQVRLDEVTSIGAEVVSRLVARRLEAMMPTTRQDVRDLVVDCHRWVRVTGFDTPEMTLSLRTNADPQDMLAEMVAHMPLEVLREGIAATTR